MDLFGRTFYKSRKFYDDDFDWDNYTSDSYERRLKGDVEAEFQTKINSEDAQFDAATGDLKLAGQPMHPNPHLILEVIGRLKPASVHEVGCGGGDHIANVARLYPDTEITGGDRGVAQLELALRRHPELKNRIGIQDITMPWSGAWPRADLVYSQAVLMHIHTAASHFVALSNMVRMSNKCVMLVENNQCHNFADDITALKAGGHLHWEDLHLHLVEGSAGARAILISRAPLDYPVLHSDEQLRGDTKRSARRLKRAAEDSSRGLFGFSKPN